MAPHDPLPLEDYGLIGNMRTGALVGKNGSVDWLCLPHFDSPSVFGAILDPEKAGRFDIRVSGDAATWQVYLPDTNVLVTRFTGEEGAAEIVDYMPVGLEGPEGGYHRLIRHVRVLRGTVNVSVHCEPAFDYGRAEHTATYTEGEGVVFEAASGGKGGGPIRLALSTKRGMELTKGACGPGAVRELEMTRGDRATFEVRLLEEGESLDEPLSREDEYALFRSTTGFWRSWLKTCSYTGRWRESVHRSALVLKMLTFEPTGAIVAAPTTSLPENIGGHRNWDYRYSWIRDAAFTLYGLLRIGFTAEVRSFILWLRERCEAGVADDPNGPLQIVYGIDGRRNLKEEELDHLSGYRDSRPVRIGNGAHDQLQLDIYGELLDAVYLYDKYGTPISWDFWQDLTRYVDWVCKNWDRPDEGIWEVRGQQEHFVYSKLMCWVALDRALRLADKRSLPAPRQRWTETRDLIYQTIMEKGYNEERGAFVQTFGGDALDASNLLMPLVFFTGPNDPRMISTLEETLKAPEEGGLTSDCLVWRYNTREVDDGVGGEEGAFNLCSFWLVEALARAGRIEPKYLEKAEVMFAKMLNYSNHLGLFAEMTGLRGQALGNTPQAFSHLGLISAAYNLDRTLNEAQDLRSSRAAEVHAPEASGDAGSPATHPGASPHSQPGTTAAR
ncbi:glycoside hydrolase family 15 protein [Rubricoccus marinus]|uniref:Glucoamylase n=1 Tax=Rubricoccus marinus TaxID=716817 RepID=A0A259TVK1_9BACT|nr:glycoside hydrolase family 15 protein [Rubricoccus marinus]OZC01720.1 glucoamylase [Rubricoccus marinus]